jgi:5-methylcytosine-specific restriction protein B
MHYGTAVPEGIKLLEEFTGKKEISYFQIAPGERARLWEDLYKNSIAAVGYGPMDADLSGMTKDQMVKFYKDTSPQSSETEAKIQAAMLYNFVNLKPGDRFVTNKGRSLLLGLGIIKGHYQFRPDRSEYKHTVAVEYYKVSEEGIPIPEDWKGKFGKTLIPLSKSEFQAMEKLFDVPTKGQNPNSPFSVQTFDLLKSIRDNPTGAFYQAHKEEFKNFLEVPFQKLFHDVCLLLPRSLHNMLESEKGNFSRIVKNDFGKGGAWDFYWGALYPKGGQRIRDAQLFLWMNADRFEYGFYIGEYGGEQRKRFVLNCSKFKEILPNLLEESLSDGELKFGRHEEFLGKTQDSSSGEISNWRNWLSNPEAAGIHVYIQVSRDNVLTESGDRIVQNIAGKFKQLFPLVLLATSDDPIKMISEYEELEVEKGTNPLYPLVQCAKETGIEEEALSRWVRAIERKGQAIFYGPPGTGKTFIAERIARHLIGGGDGFSELVQFHPAYAYEDFIQGIRPKVNTEGVLNYPVVSGRFLDFCSQAAMRQGKCVLIIDEINRANLSRVFGELMYLLEYRNREIPLASGGQLQIPNNVRILGTMNTADRSIALVDHALRRRFAFLPLYPDYGILRKFHQESGFSVNGLVSVLENLNKKIGDRHYEVGITFFLRNDLREQVEDIWRMEIEPYLEEYFFDRRDTGDEFLWDKIKDKVIS